MINKYEWLTCHLTFTSKGGTPCLELSTFFVICGNLLNFTKLILPEADFDGLFPGKVHKISDLWYQAHHYRNFSTGRALCWLYYAVLRLIRSERLEFCFCKSKTNYIQVVYMVHLLNPTWKMKKIFSVFLYLGNGTFYL